MLINPGQCRSLLVAIIALTVRTMVLTWANPDLLGIEDVGGCLSGPVPCAQPVSVALTVLWYTVLSGLIL
jgi:hypothetical protein